MSDDTKAKIRDLIAAAKQTWGRGSKRFPWGVIGLTDAVMSSYSVDSDYVT
jgi:hypothetical protein